LLDFIDASLEIITAYQSDVVVKRRRNDGLIGIAVGATVKSVAGEEREVEVGVGEFVNSGICDTTTSVVGIFPNRQIKNTVANMMIPLSPIQSDFGRAILRCPVAGFANATKPFLAVR
jgi:hypothetical protein